MEPRNQNLKVVLIQLIHRLNHLSYASKSFCSGYFGVKVSLFVQANLDCDPLILSFLLLLRRQAQNTMSSLFPLKFYCLGWHQTTILLILASQEAVCTRFLNKRNHWSLFKARKKITYFSWSQVRSIKL
jgi:hypothetical protein